MTAFTDQEFVSGTTITSAWLNGVNDKLKDFVSVKDFGAVGDGLTNDTVAINNAIAYGIANGKTVFIPGGTYQFNGYTNTSQAITLSIEGEAGNLPRLVKSQASADAGGYMFLLNSTRYSTVSGLMLAANIKPNQQTISLTSVAGLSAGMVIQISSNRLWYNGHRSTYYCGEIHKITSVDSGANTIQIEDFTRDTYTVGVDTLVIRAWSPNKVSIKNLRIEAPYPATVVTSVGIALQQCIDSEINNVYFKGFGNCSILDNLGWNCRFVNINVDQDGGMNTTTTGYGIESNGSVGTLVDGLYTKGCRRAFDAGALSGTSLAAICRDWKVQNFNVNGGGAWFPVTAEISYGVGMHGPSENGVICNGIIHDCSNGITARGRNTIVENVRFSGSFNDAISLHEEGAGLIVRGCVYDNYNYPDKFASLADIVAGTGCETFVRLGLTTGGTDGHCLFTLPIIIEDNTCKGLTESFISVGQNTRTVTGLRLANNYIEAVPGAAGTFTVYKADFATTNWTNSVIENNTVVEINGTTVEYSTNFVLAYRAASTIDFRIDGVRYARIPNDSFVRIPRVAKAGQRIIVMAHADGGGYAFVRLLPNSTGFTSMGATPTVGWGATATGSALNGTTGAASSVTLGLEANGDLYIENRFGAIYTFRLTVQ